MAAHAALDPDQPAREVDVAPEEGPQLAAAQAGVERAAPERPVLGAKSCDQRRGLGWIGDPLATTARGGCGCDSTRATCGDLPARLLYSIETQKVVCTVARLIAVQWGSQCAQLRTGSCLVTALFYCRYRDTGYESGRIKCIHDADLRRPLRAQRTVVFVTSS